MLAYHPIWGDLRNLLTIKFKTSKNSNHYSRTHTRNKLYSAKDLKPLFRALLKVVTLLDFIAYFLVNWKK